MSLFAGTRTKRVRAGQLPDRLQAMGATSRHDKSKNVIVIWHRVRTLSYTCPLVIPQLSIKNPSYRADRCLWLSDIVIHDMEHGCAPSLCLQFMESNDDDPEIIVYIP